MADTNLENVRNGFCRAIGALPVLVLHDPQRLRRLTEGLLTCTQGSQRTFKWAESRRLAVLALVSVVDKSIALLPDELLLKIGDAILDTLQDYTVDSRGDIGAM